MTINLVVAVTDGEWFDLLFRERYLSEVNFWAPSSGNFKALQPGELFLFKLRTPRNYIVCGGVFANATSLPCSLAWQAFGTANGARTQAEMRRRTAKYRRVPPEDRSDFVIRCRILTQPFFLSERAWISVPDSWAANIVSFKGYSTDHPDGRRLWEWAQAALSASTARGLAEEQARYGEPVLARPRLGHGAFRVVVTDSYRRRCAVSGEKTLPALDAAHIRPYADGGSHEASNGILLRRDILSLFDAGYLTITPDMRFEVSRRIREEFENGRHYYELHGRGIELPDDCARLPERSALTWHNETKFLG